ncbi:VanZ family protein [Kineosporia rhizophila]|uniref:VanZ family protein n=1 Tax=Kineosporia rhizophila TaxID=84633 RepID=UPI001E29CDE9|nr:VanZ family protein [Kineosporia rhizophila]
MASWISRLGPADLLFGAALLAALVSVLVFVAQRGAGARKLVGIGAFGGYLVVLALIILCPLPGPAPEPAFPGAPAVPLLQISTEVELRGLLTSGLGDQNLQNLLLGVPFGFGLPFLLRRGGRWLIAACLLFGAGLEASQAAASLLAGWAYRSIDVNDLIANDLGALLGLLLFSVANQWFSFRPGLAGRAVLLGSPVAAGVVALALLAGPRPGLEPGVNYCEVPPATVTEVEGYSVFADHDVVCLTNQQGFLTLLPGDQTPAVESPQAEVVNVVGLVPVGTTRVRVDLGDGQSAEARLVPVAGIDDWTVYVAAMRKGPLDDFTVQVTRFAADGTSVVQPAVP